MYTEPAAQQSEWCETNYFNEVALRAIERSFEYILSSVRGGSAARVRELTRQENIPLEIVNTDVTDVMFFPRVAKCLLKGFALKLAWRDDNGVYRVARDSREAIDGDGV